jgi:4-amino-4-deoxy-L-arabinose transferase-like glycosyltransferase
MPLARLSSIRNLRSKGRSIEPHILFGLGRIPTYNRLKSKKTTVANGFLPELRGIHIFALIFTAIFLLHLPLLRLPYFWDEAGYYVPAAYDFFTGGHLVPQSVPSNAHPPLLSIYLSLWWKLSAFKPAVTRTAMLLLTGLSLVAVFRLARLLTNTGIAVAVVACTALYPVWFAQSCLAHADLPAATFVLWGMFFYFRSMLPFFSDTDPRPILVKEGEIAAERTESNRNALIAALLFALAGLSKETSIVVPLTLAAYDVVGESRRVRGLRRKNLLRPLVLLLTIVPLAGWFAYHHHRTGFIFGNPDFFAYNVSGTLTPLRVVLSLGLRLWQMLGYMDLWLLTLATLWVMHYPALQEADGSERRRIDLAVQYRIAAILAANVAVFSAVGGAALARYLLPTYPLVILIGISTLRRRLAEWTWAVVLITVGFVLALFSNPFGYIPPEDNLSYRNYVILHKQAADYLEQRDPHARVLTAWTATDELTKPFLGYVRQPLQVVRINDFSYGQLQLARMASGEYDLALLFSTKQEPSASLLDRWPSWQRMSRKYFGFHRDVPPEVAAQFLGGRLTWERRCGRQWIAVVSFDRVENAALHHQGTASRGTQLLH